ncbi:MAG TPA: TROVE domain-containing protein, partial [Xanthomonadales bacterium]|nr:TROVE domain-containing protein [Xanthomonadales bacterium]
MANRSLFGGLTNLLKRPDVVNHEGAPAYSLSPRHALAQLAMTGCLNSTFYADAETQLGEVLSRCFEVEPAYVAKTAVYARRHGRMKDLPGLLCAWLAAFDGALLERVFDRVVDNGTMLRNFVQVVRSGRVARKSLGSLPKRLVQRWLVEASDERLIRALVGQQPSLADVIRMVHPKPKDAAREALFGYVLGREVDVAKLPAALQAFERFKRDASADVPDVPFQLLTALELTTAHWTAIARQVGWTALRMNLNTFARHGVFEDRAALRAVARRLGDEHEVRKARVFPYQLLAARRATTALPAEIREALERALEHATANVPAVCGSVAIAVDVSGSMESPVTGHRRGATTSVRCVDAAALLAASMLAANPGAVVLPFNDQVRSWTGRSRSVAQTAEALAQLLGGGTNVSAPLAELVRRNMAPDLIVIVSDNQSWIDARQHGATETLRQWEKLKQH